MKRFELEIMERERSLFKAEVYFLKLPAREGEVGILPGHADMILTLRPGAILVKVSEEEKPVTFSLSKGGAFRFFQNKACCILY